MAERGIKIRRAERGILSKSPCSFRIHVSIAITCLSLSVHSSMQILNAQTDAGSLGPSAASFEVWHPQQITTSARSHQRIPFIHQAASNLSDTLYERFGLHSQSHMTNARL